MAGFRSQTRRRTLKAFSGAVVGLGFANVAAGKENDPSVTFEDQATTGNEITIAEVITDDAVHYSLKDQDGKRFVSGDFDSGQHLENVTIELDEPITESGNYRFSIYPIEGGQALDSEVAHVLVTAEGEYREALPVTLVESDSEYGFNYPYLLYVPPTTGEWDENTPLLVEPNNSPSSKDDFSYHKQVARDLIQNGPPRQVSEELGTPLLVPVFPRPRSEPVDGTHLTHQLDRETLQISEGPLERIDIQLLRMIDHAQEKLESQSYPVREEIIMNGFSSSGNFADRFTMLHPERVLSVTAGGVNGMVVLPREEAKGHTLDYHIGIADVEELTGTSVDLEALKDVNQFYYMGSEDTNDTIGYDGPWTSDELEQVALDVYGEDMVEDRFPYSEQIYNEVGIEANFKVYDGVGHTPIPALQDIIKFHREVLPEDDPTTTTSQSTDTTTETSSSNTSTEMDTGTTTNKANHATTATTEGTTSTQTESPGFGVVTSLVGLVTASYLGIRRRI